jgi:hypothetical protein
MLSITSLALAIVALAVFWSVAVATVFQVPATDSGVAFVVAAVAGVILGIGAVVTGVVARRRVRRGQAGRGGIALAGIVLGVVAFRKRRPPSTSASKNVRGSSTPCVAKKLDGDSSRRPPC